MPVDSTYRTHSQCKTLKKEDNIENELLETSIYLTG